MIYEHEKRERANNGEIKHVAMPIAVPRHTPMMLAYLTDRELDYELARSNGWYPTTARGPRIVIPCVNSYGFNYWQARAMDDSSLRYDSPAIPRRDSIVMLWPRKKPEKRRFDTVVITEGPMKSLAAAEFYPSIATMGASPSEEVMVHIEKKIRELGLTNVIVVPDTDALEYVGQFLHLNPRVIIPTCKDLDKMPRWEREKLLA